jgi:hypothetical protein
MTAIEEEIAKADRISDTQLANEKLNATLKEPAGFKELNKTRNEISRILRTDMQAREKYTLVTEIAYKHFLESGKFYFDERIREGYWFDDFSKQLLKIQSEKFQSFLSERLEINQEDTVFRWILSGLKNRASERAPKVEPKKFSFFDEEKSTLFLNNAPGSTLRINADKIEEVDNGEGVLFLWEESWEDFQFVEDTQSGLIRSFIYEKHVLDDQLEGNLTIEELSALLDIYILSILFRSVVLHRPLLAYIGPWGCGKTLMQTLIGMMLFGKNFGVLGIEDQKQDGVIAYITNSIFGVIDNADEKIKWLPDMLAKTATGQSFPRRKLYTTNELINYSTDCFLGITARATPWARPDVISRLLLVKFKQPENYLDEKKLQKDVLENRDKLLSELILRTKEAIRKLNETKDNDYNSPSRLAGFFTFAQRTTENPSVLNQAIAKTQGLQNSLASEEEETLLTVLRKWLEINLTVKTIDQSNPGWTTPITTAKLFGELCQIAKNDGIELGIRKSNSLGMILKNNSAMLKAEGIRFKTRRSTQGTLWWFTERKSQERPS